jgi:hypothetical protein
MSIEPLFCAMVLAPVVLVEVEGAGPPSVPAFASTPLALPATDPVELVAVVACIFDEPTVEVPVAAEVSVFDGAAPLWVSVDPETPLGWPPAMVPVAPSLVVPFIVWAAWTAGEALPVAAGPMTFSICDSLALQSAKAGLAKMPSATTAAEYFKNFMEALLERLCLSPHQTPRISLKPFAQAAVPLISIDCNRNGQGV